jgi:hypothetical protein
LLSSSAGLVAQPAISQAAAKTATIDFMSALLVGLLGRLLDLKRGVLRSVATSCRKLRSTASILAPSALESAWLLTRYFFRHSFMKRAKPPIGHFRDEMITFREIQIVPPNWPAPVGPLDARLDIAP